jgi:hypothetical protein
MVTLALFAMVGLLGLAVDLGWSYFVRRAAQAAADTAAKAAVEQALAAAGQSGTFSCSTNMTCQPITPCPASPSSPPGTNVELACLYAQRNGFTVGGNGGKQNVTVEAQVPDPSCINAGSNTPPTCVVPYAPGVAAFYWVTVRVAETVPQLFSAILGNTTATVSARATAAVVESVNLGSLILINRENDTVPTDPKSPGTGFNLRYEGGGGQQAPSINVPGGVLLSSNCAGTNCSGGIWGGGSGAEAGKLSGSANLTSPYTYVRTGGRACAGNIPGCSQVGNSTWVAPYNNKSDGDYFYDPMRDKGQPPLTNQIVPPVKVLGGTIAGGTAQSPTILTPANYFATNLAGDTATGEPVTLGGGYFEFRSCSGCSGGTGFGDYFFWGGLKTGGGNTTVTLNPGRYALVGQNPSTPGEKGLLFLSNGTTLQDYTPGDMTGSDPGEILIFTGFKDPSDPGYGGANQGVDLQLQGLLANFTADGLLLANAKSQNKFAFAPSGFTMGQNDQSSINLSGLDRQHPDLQPGGQLDVLRNFTPAALWQDQRNSRVKYCVNGDCLQYDLQEGKDGNIDLWSCNGGAQLPLETPCTNDPPEDMARLMNMQATPNTNLYGLVYQPRGAFMNLTGGGNMAGPLQVITGAINFQGGPGVVLTSVTKPVIRRIVALVE